MVLIVSEACEGSLFYVACGDYGRKKNRKVPKKGGKNTNGR